MASLGWRKGPIRGPQIVRGTAAVDPASIGAGAAGTASISITGLQATDIVVLEPPSALEAGLVYRGCVVAAGAVTILLTNPTAGSVDGTSRTWTYKVIKSA